MLQQQIEQAFLEAFKARDELKTSVLRMLKTSLMNKKIEKLIAKEDFLPDEEVIAVLKTEAKKRQDSIESYRQGGREELAQKEEAEIVIIKQFLPEQMSEDAVMVLTQEVIAEMGNPGSAGFGKIMGAVMAKAKGAADGAIVSKIVKEKLAKQV